MTRPLPPPQALDVSALLQIDVTAEIRKLSQARLEGPWQIPTELVRRSLSYLANTVDITLDRRSLTIRDDGDPLPRELLQALATLLDEGAAPEARHRALLAIEEEEATALIALAGLPMERLRIDVRDEHRSDRLQFERGGPPRLTLDVAEDEEWETRIEVTGADLDPRQARDWLESACRFAQAVITLDGETLVDPDELPMRWTHALPYVRITDPIELEMGLPREGETACVWLLLDGVVSTHLTLVTVPYFEAAVEMRGLVEADESAAALRDAIHPRLPGLLGVAQGLVWSLARALHELDADQQRRVRTQVALAAKHDVVPDMLAKLRAQPVYPAAPCPGDESPRWLSLDDLSRLAEENGRLLTVLHPGDDPARYVLPPSPVLVLDKTERGLLTGLLRVGFRAPALRPTGLGPLARAWRALAGEDGLLARAVRRLRPPPPPLLPGEALSPAERGFLEELQRALATGAGGPAELRFCEGAGPIRRQGRSPHWVLPRENPTVQDCLKAWSRDPTWIYPAALAVLNGSGLPARKSRGAWLERWVDPPTRGP